jgi:hypothetical protein
MFITTPTFGIAELARTSPQTTYLVSASPVNRRSSASRPGVLGFAPGSAQRSGVMRISITPSTAYFVVSGLTSCCVSIFSNMGSSSAEEIGHRLLQSLDAENPFKLLRSLPDRFSNLLAAEARDVDFRVSSATYPFLTIDRKPEIPTPRACVRSISEPRGNRFLSVDLWSLAPRLT